MTNHNREVDDHTLYHCHMDKQQVTSNDLNIIDWDRNPDSGQLDDFITAESDRLHSSLHENCPVSMLETKYCFECLPITANTLTCLIQEQLK